MTCNMYLQKLLINKRILWILCLCGILTYLIPPALLTQINVNFSFYDFDKAWLDNPDQSAFTQSSNEIKRSFRIQLSRWGNCVGSSSSNTHRLEVVFCDPNEKQTFNWKEDGQLIFEKTERCMEMAGGITEFHNETFGASQLLLGDCTDSERAARFSLVNNSYLQLKVKSTDLGAPICLTPVMSTNSSRSRPHHKAHQGTLLGLTVCHEGASQITLIEENTFRENRKALLLPPQLNQDPSCTFPACAINAKTSPVKLLPAEEVSRCHNVSECVTLVTKTARRPELVLRMVQSLRSVKGYDLPTIVYDDGGEPYPDNNVMKSLSNLTFLRYIIGDREDLGIALGRTLAIQQVKTKYLLLLDDDSVINEYTDIELLTEILDTTDASLVGGKITWYKHFAGFLQLSNGQNEDQGKRVLFLYRDGRHYANESVVNFPSCRRCDVTSNVFMAKTKDILEVGGWSPELKVGEHKDLFLRLKAAKKKVVYCPGFQVFNRKETVKSSKESGYHSLRMGRRSNMQKVFLNLWNIHAIHDQNLNNKVPTSELEQLLDKIIWRQD